MYKNVTEKVPYDNIVCTKKNQVVISQDFVFDKLDFSSKFDTEEYMLKEIMISCRLYYCILGKRLHYFAAYDICNYDSTTFDVEREVNDNGMWIDIVINY